MDEQQRIISVTDLTKSYGNEKVLDGISFSVHAGEILALLGPNGAGKTTTVGILSTLIKPLSGNISVCGYSLHHEASKVRENIGLTGQFAAVDEYLTGRENIILVGKLYHLSPKYISQRTEELIQRFDLADFADKTVKTYSGGMKRRLDLAMSLVKEPPVVFLDEPTTGLDPRSRLQLWQTIKELKKSGVALVLTTQYMDEADYLADTIIVIDHGKVIASGTPNELKEFIGAHKITFRFHSIEELEHASMLLQGVPDKEQNLLTMEAPSKSESLLQALTLLGQNNIFPDTATLNRPTLDDVFLTLTGHPATEEVSLEEGGTNA